MNIISQLAKIDELLRADNWRELISAQFPGCDMRVWEKARRSLLGGQPKRRRASRRTSKASQVAAQGRAMAAMVVRVNEPVQKMTLAQQAEMEAAWNAANPDDGYGLEPREIGDLRW